MNEINTKQTQQELRERYREIQKKRWSSNEKMINFCVDSVTRFVLLDNGSIAIILKPPIKKSFCFGYSFDSGNNDSYDRALSMVEHASTKDDYFLEKNLEEMLKKKERLNGEFRDYGNNLLHPCIYQDHSSKEVSEIAFRNDEDIREGGYTKLSENERKAFVEAYDIEIEAFQKRLLAYLKRYGLSNINVWSYWRDE